MMKSRSLLCSFFLAIWMSHASAQSISISIHGPSDDAVVEHRTYVRGHVTDPGAEVWVVVHPMDTSGYWIQPPIAVKNDGSWRVKAHFGRAGRVDSGKDFEIRAFANPRNRLREGKSGQWPTAAAQSNVVDVSRK